MKRFLIKRQKLLKHNSRKIIMNKNHDAFNNKNIKVPFVVPNITSTDRKTIQKALSSKLLTDGPNVRNFEKKFSKFTKSKFSIGVSNATAALQLSLRAIGITKNDEVIIPDITFVATANSVLYCNATPVLADVDKDDFNISADSIEENISKRTKAIIPVHFAGKSCNMKKIMKIAKKYNLKIIEDCAHGLGTYYEGKHVGNFGETGCFSFYPTKNLTTFEGGMIISSSRKTADYVKKGRNHGISKSLKDRFTKGLPWDYDVSELGYNFRLDEIRSALGINQLTRLDKMNYLRQTAASYYNSKLKDNEGISIPTIENSKSNSWHLYVVKILDGFKLSRNDLFKKLLQKGIRTSVHYKPLHLFKLYKKSTKTYSNLKNSSHVYEQMLSLPMFPTISKKELNIVTDSINSYR